MRSGSSMKGHVMMNSHGSSRARSLGLMLLLAFGAAVLGVMLLHKLRERRIFSLLVKHKDQDLASLHLLLQKERRYSMDAARKIEEMKAKMYKLRAQNTELDSKNLELRSLISSLKDEQRTIELALEEKEGEIKMLRERQAEANAAENPQVAVLTEIVRQKDGEIEDLKHRLALPIKVWSVSADDPSKPPINTTENASLASNNESETAGKNENKQSRDSEGFSGNEGGKSNSEHKDNSNQEAGSVASKESANNGENRMGNGDRDGNINRRETLSEEYQKAENAEQGFGQGSTDIPGRAIDGEISTSRDSQSAEVFNMTKSNGENATETTGTHQGQMEIAGDMSDIKVADQKDMATKYRNELKDHPNSDDESNLESGLRYQGGMKLEMPDKGHDSTSSATVHHAHSKKTKAKRWRTVAGRGALKKYIRDESGEVTGKQRRRFFKDASEIKNERIQNDEAESFQNPKTNSDMEKEIRLLTEPEALDPIEQGGRRNADGYIATLKEETKNDSMVKRVEGTKAKSIRFASSDLNQKNFVDLSSMNSQENDAINEKPKEINTGEKNLILSEARTEKPDALLEEKAITSKQQSEQIEAQDDDHQLQQPEVAEKEREAYDLEDQDVQETEEEAEASSNTTNNLQGNEDESEKPSGEEF